MKPSIRSALVLVATSLSAATYARLPDLVPVRWSSIGAAPELAPRAALVFGAPVLMLAVRGLFAVAPRVSPRGFSMAGFPAALARIERAILGFLVAVHALVTAAALGAPVPVASAIRAAVGVLFMLLASPLAATTPNFFVGIRTPWTLASGEVWERTHRLAAKLFVVAGAAIVVASLAGVGAVAVPLAALVAAGVPAAYSYFAYRHAEA
jgi:uncharacterized membrane protein